MKKDTEKSRNNSHSAHATQGHDEGLRGRHHLHVIGLALLPPCCFYYHNLILAGGQKYGNNENIIKINKLT